MYYIIERSYVGVDRGMESHATDRIIIQDEPGAVDRDGDPIAVGYLGKAQEYSIVAYGAYEDIESAEKAIFSLFGECRKMDSTDPRHVASYAPGRFYPVHDAELSLYIFSECPSHISQESTDEEIKKASMEIEHGIQSTHNASAGEDRIFEYIKKNIDLF